MHDPSSDPIKKELDSETQTPSLAGASRRSVNGDDTDHDGQIPSTTLRAGAKEDLVNSLLP